MNVLSLFDGISCGRVALERCGFTINNYLDTIHIGDVTKVRAKDLDPIDLVIGGSPCQGFSFAGKQLNFEDPRSKLFFEFVRLVKECKPKYFFLENVVMKKEFQDVISSYLGVQPIMLNSALVSAQSRKRLYWTNIPGYTPPEDKGIPLKDILETGAFDYVKVSKKGVYKNTQDKASCLTAGGNSGGNHSDMDLIGIKRDCLQVGMAQDINGHDILKRIYSVFGKSPTLSTCGGGNTQPKIALNEYEYRRLTPLEFERLQTLPDNYTAGVSSSQRYKMLGNGWTVDAVCEFFKHIPKDLDLF